MGTNYYARYSPCPICHRCSAEKHIGKSSVGWRFLFQSHADISSWCDWKIELQQSGVQIWNEYNERMSLEELLEIVEVKQADPRNIIHTDYQDLKYPFERRYWRQDSDGYSFSNEEFS